MYFNIKKFFFTMLCICRKNHIMSNKYRSGGKYGGSYNTRNYSLFAINQKVNANIKATAQLASLLNVEYKHKDVEASGTFSNAGTMIHLTPISQGDGVQNRDANQVKCFSINAKWEIVGNASADSFQRIIFFLDTESRNATPPTTTELLESAAISSFINYDQKKRFMILKDLRGHTDTDNELRLGKWYKKINFKLNWDGVDGEDYVNNQLWCLMLTNIGATQPTYVLKTRVLFLDN